MALFTVVAGGVKVAVRVTPKASRDKIEGPVEMAEGEVALKLAVSAPPEDGKANDAVLRLLSKAWKIPKSSLAVVSGATSRSKTVLVSATNPQNIYDFLIDWVKTQ